VREAPLATRIGISRRAVRKALHTLADEGPLQRLPEGGTAIPHVDILGILDLYALRSALGAVLMRRAAMLSTAQLRPVFSALSDVQLAARKHDRGRIGELDLHFQNVLARTVDLPQTSLFFERLTLRLRMFVAVLRLDFADTAADLIARENERIVDALRDGNGEEAARLWRVKMERSVRYMAGLLPDSTFDPTLWAALAGKPEAHAGDPRKSSGA
jgi:DNA-binding GntR family transcriptional regulator